MSREYTNAEIVFARKIERVLSEILSEKYDCDIKIRYLPKELGDGVIPPNHELRTTYDPVRGNTVEFFPIEPKEGDEKHESDHKRANRKLRSTGS